MRFLEWIISKFNLRKRVILFINVFLNFIQCILSDTIVYQDAGIFHLGPESRWKKILEMRTRQEEEGNTSTSEVMSACSGPAPA